MTNRRRILVFFAAAMLLATRSVTRDVVRHHQIPIEPDTTKGKKVNVCDDFVDAQHGPPVVWSIRNVE